MDRIRQQNVAQKMPCSFENFFFLSSMNLYKNKKNCYPNRKIILPKFCDILRRIQAGTRKMKILQPFLSYSFPSYLSHRGALIIPQINPRQQGNYNGASFQRRVVLSKTFNHPKSSNGFMRQNFLEMFILAVAD